MSYIEESNSLEKEKMDSDPLLLNDVTSSIASLDDCRVFTIFPKSLIFHYGFENIVNTWLTSNGALDNVTQDNRGSESKKKKIKNKKRISTLFLVTFQLP